MCVRRPKMVGYVKYFKNSSTTDKKKYNEIWKKISSLMGEEFDNDPVYENNDKYINSKIKSYGDNIQMTFMIKGYQEKMYHYMYHVIVCL